MNRCPDGYHFIEALRQRERSTVDLIQVIFGGDEDRMDDGLLVRLRPKQGVPTTSSSLNNPFPSAHVGYHASRPGDVLQGMFAGEVDILPFEAHG